MQNCKISWHETGVIPRAANRATSLASSQPLDHITGLPSGVGSVLRCPCNVNRPSVLGLYASTSLQKHPANAQTEKRAYSNKTLRQTLKYINRDVPGQRKGIISNNAKEESQSNRQVCALFLAMNSLLHEYMFLAMNPLIFAAPRVESDFLPSPSPPWLQIAKQVSVKASGTMVKW